MPLSLRRRPVGYEEVKQIEHIAGKTEEKRETGQLCRGISDTDNFQSQKYHVKELCSAI